MPIRLSRTSVAYVLIIRFFFFPPVFCLASDHHEEVRQEALRECGRSVYVEQEDSSPWGEFITWLGVTRNNYQSECNWLLRYAYAVRLTCLRIQLSGGFIGCLSSFAS